MHATVDRVPEVLGEEVSDSDKVADPQAEALMEALEERLRVVETRAAAAAAVQAGEAGGGS